MIISLDKESNVHGTELALNYPSAIFGISFVFGDSQVYTDVLAQGEDLFLTAHAMRGAIGNARGEPRFSPKALAAWLRECVLPWNYQGSIYLSTDGPIPGFIRCLQASDALGREYAERLFYAVNADLRVAPAWHDDWIMVQ